MLPHRHDDTHGMSMQIYSAVYKCDSESLVSQAEMLSWLMYSVVCTCNAICSIVLYFVFPLYQWYFAVGDICSEYQPLLARLIRPFYQDVISTRFDLHVWAAMNITVIGCRTINLFVFSFSLFLPRFLLSLSLATFFFSHFSLSYFFPIFFSGSFFLIYSFLIPLVVLISLLLHDI